MIINNYNDRFNQIIQRGHTNNTISPNDYNSVKNLKILNSTNFAKSKFFLWLFRLSL